MKVGILSQEFYPYIKGGAGIHVQYLAQALKKYLDLEVRCFADKNYKYKGLNIYGYSSSKEVIGTNKGGEKRIFDTLYRSIMMSQNPNDYDIVHSHTWYTNLAGFLMKQMYRIPHVMTVHSVEPFRPWKRDQLENGYDLSCWIEKTAAQNADRIIAVSESAKLDIIRAYGWEKGQIKVIHNGVDTDVFKPTKSTKALVKYNVPTDKPYILFIGRATKQKGFPYFLACLHHLKSDANIVIITGEADQAMIQKDIKDEIRQHRMEIIQVPWLSSKKELREIYSNAALYVSTSIYEAFPITLLEVMACETAVVSTAVGGIPEVVIPEETGTLISFKSKDEIDPTPRNERSLVNSLAKAIDELLDNPKKAEMFGKRGRELILENFTWERVAHETVKLYKSLIR